MIDYHLYDGNRVYIETVEVDEMAELPINGTSIEPPELAEGEMARWLGGSWEVITEINHPNVDLDVLKADYISALANKRWEVEVGGIVVNGLYIPTDDKTQSRVDQIVKAYEDGDIYGEIKFKSVSGGEIIWFPIDEMMIKLMKSAGAQHIQACFAREFELFQQIQNAETIEELSSIDINADWPS